MHTVSPDYRIDYMALNTRPDAEVLRDMHEFLEIVDFVAQADAPSGYETSGLWQGVILRIRWSSGASNVFSLVLEGNDDAELREARLRLQGVLPAYFDWHMLCYDGLARGRTIDAYTQIHDLENRLRRIIACLLAAKYGASWWTTGGSPELTGLRAKCAHRKTQEEADLEHDFQAVHDIFYADFSDLSKIIEDATFWADVFEAVFVRKGASYKLAELTPLRNRVMHNRYLTQENSAKIDIYRQTLDRFLKAGEHSVFG